MAERGKFVIHMEIDVDLSENGAPEDFARILAKISDAGFPEFAKQIADGIEAEGRRLGYL